MDAAADEQVAEKPGSCAQCTERCLREHRAAGSGADRFSSSSAQPLHPSFLRPLMDHNMRGNMAIPKAFVQMHGRGLPGSTVDLEGANGKVWLVTVVRSPSTGTAMFRFGWQVFVADNHLKVSDSLLFTMVAKNRFTVRVFNRDGLEIANNNNNNNASASATMSHHSSQFTTPKTAAAHYNLDDSDDEFAATGHARSGENDVQARNLGGHGPTIHDVHAGILGGNGPTIQELIQSTRTYVTPEDPIRRRIINTPRNPNHPRNMPDAHQSLPPEMPGSSSTSVRSKRRPVTIAERQSALVASQRLVTAMTRPSVAVVMAPSHVYRAFFLNIPREFSREHLLYKSESVVLRDSWDHRWRAQWLGNNDEHTGIGGGWAAFSKDHWLEEGDVCVFQLLDATKYVFRVHICRVVEVPFVPGKRGPALWDIVYNTIKPGPSLPDLNDAATSDPDSHLRAKRNSLADVLQEMIRNGQFPQDKHQSTPSKLFALAEDAMHVDEDVKPEVKPLITPFKRPGTPINRFSDGSVKPEPEDVYFINSLLSHSEPHWRSAVKTEPFCVAKTEDISAEQPSQPSPASPLAVYSRRRRKDGSSAVERMWYSVLRVLQKRQREDKAEKEYLVEVLGTVSDKERCSVEQGPDGLWWVPSSHFSIDLSGCYFR